MISIEKQQKLLINLSKQLNKPVLAYAVGGTAMMFLGLKEATRDIDLVFIDDEAKNHFLKAAQALGYQKMDTFKIYGAKRNIPDLLTRGEERFDLFVKDVIDFTFSETMQKRAVDTHQFGDMLILKIANPHDLILMKCATDRIKDKDDARTIISNKNIDWNILIEEAQNQVRVGRTRAIFELGCFLEELQKLMGKKVPREVIKRVYTLVEKQVGKRIK